jgi:2-methylisocitrate lyase-like PEP mutase family enzyme
MTTTIGERRQRFRDLHEAGLFIMPNAWDAGSARLLAWTGFPAIATTSLGHAASLGRLDQSVTLDELLDHVRALAAAVEIPLSVDSERCFADTPEGVATTVEQLADAGASGCSIEDYDPARGAIERVDVATERVGAAAEAGHRHGMVLTARAENHLYGVDDLGDTIDRLRSYRRAGADVVYAPRLVEADDMRRIVEGVDAPVNILAMRSTPPIGVLRELGVRRVSTGGWLARAAYGGVVAAAHELQSAGTSTYLDAAISGDDLEQAMRRPEDPPRDPR